jgi:hypothetical protein
MIEEKGLRGIAKAYDFEIESFEAAGKVMRLGRQTRDDARLILPTGK